MHRWLLLLLLLCLCGTARAEPPQRYQLISNLILPTNMLIAGEKRLGVSVPYG